MKSRALAGHRRESPGSILCRSSSEPLQAGHGVRFVLLLEVSTAGFEPQRSSQRSARCSIVMASNTISVRFSRGVANRVDRCQRLSSPTSFVLDLHDAVPPRSQTPFDSRFLCQVFGDSAERAC